MSLSRRTVKRRRTSPKSELSYRIMRSSGLAQTGDRGLYIRAYVSGFASWEERSLGFGSRIPQTAGEKKHTLAREWIGRLHDGNITRHQTPSSQSRVASRLFFPLPFPFLLYLPYLYFFYFVSWTVSYNMFTGNGIKIFSGALCSSALTKLSMRVLRLTNVRRSSQGRATPSSQRS